MPSDTVEFECPDCGGVHPYVIEMDYQGNVIDYALKEAVHSE